MKAKPETRGPGDHDVPAALHALPPARRLAVLRSLKGSGRTISLRTTGLSMEPLISEDSEARITFMPADRVRRGDVVLFAAGDAVVLHRVVSLQRGPGGVRLIEKGDRQPFSRAISEEQFLGVMTALRTGGRVLRRDSTGWRVQAALLVLLGRVEILLYKVKTRWCGKEPTPAGRFVNRALHGIRRAVLAMTPGTRRGDKEAKEAE